MIKTLRITSIIAVVLAVVFFAVPSVFGVHGDKQIEQFLNSTGVIEGFRQARGDKVRGSRQEVSPLVKQAEAFALYLNPPPKPKPEPSASKRKTKPRPTGPVAAKFKLVGTSRHVLEPERSLALIDEPGKGLHWVRQSGNIGHLVIEQVKDGLVVVRDGENTFELTAERPEKRSLIKESSLPSGRITEGIPAEVQTGADEAEAAGEKVLAGANAELTGLEAVQKDVEIGKTDSVSQSDDVAAARKRAIAELETMRISTKEARGLGRLGRRLRNIQQRPNRAENNRTKSNANLIEPNLNRPSLNVPGESDANLPR